MVKLSERTRPLPWKSAEPAGQKLVFRTAKEEEAHELKALYENAWGCGITIDEEQIRSKIRYFPEGQIVGLDPDTGRPVSMINVMLGSFEAWRGFRGGYEEVTGGRTFSTHVPIETLLELAGESSLPVAFCVSIAVRRAYAKNGYALETLDQAIRFSEENGLFAVPYSAPRGFASARELNPRLDIETYLHLTVPSGISYEEHLSRVRRINATARISRAFRRCSGSSGLMEVTESIYGEHQSAGSDHPAMGRSQIAYFRFFGSEGEAFFNTYGRYPLIEDFCMLTGRKLLDPVMRMHVDNGARFIRDGSASLSAVFANSRPEDPASAGYNVLLTYGYHPLLGQDLS